MQYFNKECRKFIGQFVFIIVISLMAVGVISGYLNTVSEPAAVLSR